MRHVDDGTMHAWLDRQVTDPAEVAWIEVHLRECGACHARLAEERTMVEQAESLLGAVAPVADASRPAFEALVARARGSAPVDDSASSPFRVRTWAMPVSWAASLALAVVLGWIVRDRSLQEPPAVRQDRPRVDDTRQAPHAPSVQTSEVTQLQTPGVASRGQGQRQGRDGGQGQGQGQGQGASPRLRAAESPTAAQRDEPASAAKAASSDPKTSGVVGGVAGGVTPALGRGLGASAVSSKPSQESAAGAPPVAAAPPPPTDVPPPVFRSQLAEPAAPVPSPTQTAAGSVTPPSTATIEGQPLTPPPGGGGGAAGGFPAGGRGGRGGGGGGGGAGGGRGGGGGRGNVGVDGLTVNTGQAAFRSATDAAGWRQVSRTEAAARSGMPLYGIAGLTPQQTMLSADSATVRTVYRLESGETVDVTQQRIVKPAEQLGDAAVTVTAQAPVVDVQNARQQTVAGGAPANSEPQRLPPLTDGLVPTVWSTVRDNVRVTLSGPANVSALGERLRLD